MRLLRPLEAEVQARKDAFYSVMASLQAVCQADKLALLSSASLTTEDDFFEVEAAWADLKAQLSKRSGAYRHLQHVYQLSKQNAPSYADAALHHAC